MKPLGRWRPILVFALACAILLRLALPGVVSYLGDESWTFDHVQKTLAGGGWDQVGMPSSRGVRNAPMSVWVFVGLGFLGRVETPEALTRMVALLAIAGHALILLIPRILKDEEEAKPWIWAFVLAATNPILVFVERKIWAQSVLPIFDVCIFIAWLKRDKWQGSFFWGFLGAVVGQIHMAGFFFAPALAIWTRIFDPNRKTRWIPWFAGSALGALPAVPWMLYLLRERPPASPSPWWLRFRLEFYQYFASDPTGLSSEYVVGPDIVTALRYPIIGGHPTYLVGAAHVALALASAVIGVRILKNFWEKRQIIDRSETGLLLGATLIAMGAMMTLPSISIHRHYMFAIFPLPYVWVARAALRKPGGEKWLAVLFGGTLVVTAGLLSFIHDNDGARDFGKSLEAQVRDGTSPEDAKGFRR